MASRRSSEELIFGGKVTVNGSVCNTPQVIAYIVMFAFVFLLGFSAFDSKKHGQ